MNWTPPALQRHEALAKYLTLLGLDYGDEESKNHEVPEVLTLAGHSISLDSWERTLLQDSLSDSGQGQPWAPLLAEGLAFQMKCLEKLEPPPPADDGSPVLPVRLKLEELIVDAAVGLALLQETQRAIDQMVVAGEIAEAKKLTTFRNKIGHTVGRLKDEIGEEEFPRAENKAEGMVTSVDQRGLLISRSLGPNPLGAGHAWSGRRKSSPTTPNVVVKTDEQTRSKLGPLTALLVVLTILWAVFVLPKLTTPEPHILETAEFSDVPGIVSTIAKPPTVYITVDSESWSDLAPADQKAMLVKIGQVAEEQGYIGADVRDDAGTVIGRWLKARGASLVQN